MPRKYIILEGNINPPENNPGNSRNAKQSPSSNLPVKGKKLTDGKTKVTYIVIKPNVAVTYCRIANKKAVFFPFPQR